MRFLNITYSITFTLIVILFFACKKQEDIKTTSLFNTVTLDSTTLKPIANFYLEKFSGFVPVNAIFINTSLLADSNIWCLVNPTTKKLTRISTSKNYTRPFIEIKKEYFALIVKNKYGSDTTELSTDALNNKYSFESKKASGASCVSIIINSLDNVIGKKVFITVNKTSFPLRTDTIKYATFYEGWMFGTIRNINTNTAVTVLPATMFTPKLSPLVRFAFGNLQEEYLLTIRQDNAQGAFLGDVKLKLDTGLANVFPLLLPSQKPYPIVFSNPINNVNITVKIYELL